MVNRLALLVNVSAATLTALLLQGCNTKEEEPKQPTQEELDAMSGDPTADPKKEKRTRHDDTEAFRHGKKVKRSHARSAEDEENPKEEAVVEGGEGMDDEHYPCTSDEDCHKFKDKDARAWHCPEGDDGHRQCTLSTFANPEDHEKLEQEADERAAKVESGDPTTTMSEADKQALEMKGHAQMAMLTDFKGSEALHDSTSKTMGTITKSVPNTGSTGNAPAER